MGSEAPHQTGQNGAAAVMAPKEEEHPKKIVHVLVVPCPAEGHINGTLRLAQVLVAAAEGVVATFAYPARYYLLAAKRHKLAAAQKTRTKRHSALRLQPVDDGLPTEEDAIVSFELFRHAAPIFMNAVKLVLDELLSKRKLSASELPPVSLVISDTFVPWTRELADAAGLPRVEFWTSTAATYSIGTHLPLLLSKNYLPVHQDCWVGGKRWLVDAPLIDCVPGLPPFHAHELPHEFVQADGPSNFNLQFMHSAFSLAKQARSILVHSIYELEKDVFDALEAHGFPIHAVGPLVHARASVTTSTESSSSSNRAECLKWLDSQPSSSVIYVALGSFATLTPAETHALALALEASGLPFLWVIRPDAISTSLADILPAGFLERTVSKGSGFIESWAPQTEVLRHGSMGAFFSHCGWNSTLECMWEGVPMVACPRASEQRSNAKWIVGHWKMGVELEREEDGSFTKEGVERALHEVLQGSCKEGAVQAMEMARRAVEEGGTSHTNLRNFVESLHN